jgi:hypothetical protein
VPAFTNAVMNDVGGVTVALSAAETGSRMPHAALATDKRLCDGAPASINVI